jgi:hypothetical protein
MKALAAVLEAMFACCGIDHHAADGIANAALNQSMMLTMAVARVVMTSAAAAGALIAGSRFGTAAARLCRDTLISLAIVAHRLLPLSYLQIIPPGGIYGA